MDERPDLMTSQGFEWLYGEDAQGAVVQEPPAIGPVTEPGRSAPGSSADVEPSPDESAVVEPLPEPEGEWPVRPHLDPPFELGVDRPSQETPEPGFDPPSHEQEGEVFEGEDVQGWGEVDPAELDASFGPVAQLAPEPLSPVQEPTLEPPAASEAPPMTPPPPPPPPPPAPRPREPELEQASAPEPVADTSGHARPVSEPPADLPIAQGSRPDAPAADAPARAGVAETTALEAVEDHTARTSMVSSRGDIIAEGRRKVPLRERVIPNPSAVGSIFETPPPAVSKPRLTMGRVVAVVVALTLALATAVWRVEPLKEILFGAGAPSQERVDEAFGNLKGYDYRPLPEEGQTFLEGLQDVANRAAAASGEEIEIGMDMRLVFRKGRQVGGVLVTSTTPEVVGDPGWQAGFREGMSGPGAQLRPTKLMGKEAYFGSPQQLGGGSAIMFVDPDGFVFTTFATRRPIARDVARQLLEANL